MCELETTMFTRLIYATIPDVCTKFQTITSLTARNDVWSARFGIYDHLPLLSLATKI